MLLVLENLNRFMELEFEEIPQVGDEIVISSDMNGRKAVRVVSRIFGKHPDCRNYAVDCLVVTKTSWAERPE